MKDNNNILIESIFVPDTITINRYDNSLKFNRNEGKIMISYYPKLSSYLSSNNNINILIVDNGISTLRIPTIPSTTPSTTTTTPSTTTTTPTTTTPSTTIIPSIKSLQRGIVDLSIESYSLAIYSSESILLSGITINEYNYLNLNESRSDNLSIIDTIRISSDNSNFYVTKLPTIFNL